MNKDWNSVKKDGLPELKEVGTCNTYSAYESKEVVVQTKCGDRFVAYCRKVKYTNRKIKDEIAWFSHGTGGRKMKVMSTVVAWLELPDRYEGE